MHNIYLEDLPVSPVKLELRYKQPRPIRHAQKGFRYAVRYQEMEHTFVAMDAMAGWEKITQFLKRGIVRIETEKGVEIHRREMIHFHFA